MNMEESIARPGISPLIRQYSMKAEEETPNSTLVQALSSTIRKQDEDERRARKQANEWRAWLEFGQATDDADLNRLENGRKSIVEIWQRFREHHDSDSGESSLSFHDVPNVATLQKVVNDTQVKWETKKGTGLGKLKTYVSDFLGKMDDHSYLFKVIPAGDKYISLITGVVSSVVKATVSHKKIAEGFFLALVDMSSDLCFVQKKTDIWDSPEMRKFVVDFYIIVFEFLCHAMLWFIRRGTRLRSIWNKNFYDDTVKRMVDRMKAAMGRIQSEASHLAEVQVQQISMGLGAFLGNFRPTSDDSMNKFLLLQVVGSESHDDDQAKIHQKQHRFAQLVGVGACSLKSLQAAEEHIEYESRKIHAYSAAQDNSRDIEVVEDETSDEASEPGLSNQEAAVVALLYSTIAQLARLIPAEVPAAPELHEQQFELLDGSIGSALVALRIIQALIVHAPPSMIWVIDGLQLAESRSTISLLSSFFEILRRQEELRISKVCFTTDGNSVVLTRGISVHEHVDGSRMVQGGPGRQLRGGGDVFVELNRW
ncbi:hypothetical protein PENSUB_10707 [Penicillium subrubescens]|uniref:DUF7708 domain-containing protein n=1 Tax=Penicillium subrubescens TaxID=1316194 RepID=A0A1Q5T8I0_9EURO|nr:hypothetical protein PENSUB_10707 [Penicillium subrubescens]